MYIFEYDDKDTTYKDERGLTYTKESLLKSIFNHTTIGGGGVYGGDGISGSWDGTVPPGVPAELSQWVEADKIKYAKSVSIPQDFIPLFKKYAPSWCDWRLFAALIFKESSFQPTAHNYAGKAGHWGLGQLSWEYFANEFPKGKSAEPGGVYNPDDNLRVSGRVLNDVFKNISKLTSDKQLAIFITISAYNSGEAGGVCNQWKKHKDLIKAYDNTSSVENKRYAPTILGIYEVFKERY